MVASDKPSTNESGIDFGVTAADYARHRAGFPRSLFQRLIESHIANPGERLVDLGTGTGTLARGFASRGLEVVAIDPARALMLAARDMGATTLAPGDYVCAFAEALPLPSSWADIITAGQCWHWFERSQAAPEALRVLKPGGNIVIAHYDWLPLRGNLVEATESLIKQFNPAWTMDGGSGIYPEWPRDLAEAGFERIETYSYDEPAEYTPDGWRGRIRASAGVSASLSPAEVLAFDEALAHLLASRFPGELHQVPHRVFVVHALKPE